MGIPPLITADQLVTQSASDAIARLTRLVLSGAYDPPAELRAAIAALNGAVAYADRRRPTPEPPFAVERA